MLIISAVECSLKSHLMMDTLSANIHRSMTLTNVSDEAELSQILTVTLSFIGSNRNKEILDRGGALSSVHRKVSCHPPIKSA